MTLRKKAIKGDQQAIEKLQKLEEENKKKAMKGDKKAQAE